MDLFTRVDAVWQLRASVASACLLLSLLLSPSSSLPFFFSLFCFVIETIYDILRRALVIMWSQILAKPSTTAIIMIIKRKKGCICISCGNRTTVSVICCWGLIDAATAIGYTIYDERDTWPFPIQLQNFNQNQWRHCSEHHQPLSVLRMQSTINFNFDQTIRAPYTWSCYAMPN